jgi:hypothetical protein
MANKFAIANGNFNNSAIWSDGVVPTTGDDVWGNSFTITLNQDVDVSSLRTSISPIILPYNPIPLMTSNTAPSGTASAGSTSAGAAWNAFDQDAVTSWTSSTGLTTTAWISYQLTSGVVAKRYYILRPSVTTNRPSGWVFQGSNDGSSWTTLDTVVGDATASGYTSGVLANTTSYTYYRILVNTVSAGTSATLFTFEISTDTGSVYGGQNGGQFSVNTNRTISCSNATFGLQSGSTTCLSISGTSSTININSNIRSGTTNTINIVDIPSTTSTGNTINVVGDLISVTTNVVPIRTVAPNTTINVIGTVTSTGSSNTINATGTATNTNITINGNLVTVNNSIVHQSSGSVTINGNILAPTSTGYGILRTAGANITINGDVSGSVVSTGQGILVQTVGGGTITINGNVSGGAGYGVLLNAVAATLIVNGNVSAGSSAPGIGCTILTALPCRVSGNIVNSNTYNAIWHPAIQLTGTTQLLQARDASLNNKFLYSPGTSLGNPAVGDVRLGVTYSDGSLTGTLAVPTFSAVSVGVPVDNGVGTAVITITDMGALMASYVI